MELGEGILIVEDLYHGVLTKEEYENRLITEHQRKALENMEYDLDTYVNSEEFLNQVSLYEETYIKVFEEITGKSYQEYTQKKEMNKSMLSIYDALIYSNQQEVKELEYVKYTKKEEYQNFAFLDPKQQYEMYLNDMSQGIGISDGYGKYDPFVFIKNAEIEAEARGKSVIEILRIMNVGCYDLESLYPYYEAMSEEERKLYQFLFQTEGIEKAEQYLKDIEDSLNQKIGYQLAMEDIGDLQNISMEELKNRIMKDLNTNEKDFQKDVKEYLEMMDQKIGYGEDLSDEEVKTLIRLNNFIQEKPEELKELENILPVIGKGLKSGIKQFFTGLENAISDEKSLSIDDYRNMFYIQYLSQNSNTLDKFYEGSSAVGNMIPTVTLSVITSMIAPEFVPKIGQSMFFTSVFGNSKKSARVEGYSLGSSILYGLLTAGSEVAFEKMGGVFGLSDNVSKNFLVNMFQEGKEEFLQEYVCAGIDAVVLGKEINFDELPANSIDSFFMGMITAGVLNGYSGALTNGINVVYQGEKMVLDGDFLQNIGNIVKETMGNIKVQQIFNPSEKNSIPLSQIMNHSNFNKNNLIDGILSTIPEKADILTKIRIIYHKLNQSVQYNEKYLILQSKSEEIKTEQEFQEQLSIYYKNFDIQNMDENVVICSNWSRIFYELLVRSGISPSTIKIVGGKLGHRFVTVDLGSQILIADATNNYNGMTDLANSKYGSPTAGFLLVPKQEYLMSLKKDMSMNERLRFLSKEYRDSKIIEKLDNKIGYYDMEYAQELKSLENMYDKNNSMKEIDLLFSLLQIDSVSPLDIYSLLNVKGYDIFGYYNEPVCALFDSGVCVVGFSIEIEGTRKYFVKKNDKNIIIPCRDIEEYSSYFRGYINIYGNYKDLKI